MLKEGIKRTGVATLLVGGMQYSVNQYKVKQQDTNEQSVSVQIESENIKEGEMQEVKVGPGDDDKVLVARVDGVLHCVSNACTHFGAPLSKGLMVEDRVLCPWHAAAFSLKTGAHEYGPVMDGLQVFNVQEHEGKAVVTVDLNRLNKNRTLQMAKKGEDSRRFVIVGSGPAGLSCAETLRQSGFQGEIVMFGEEDCVPYDRTLLTKMIDGTTIDKVQLRSQDFLKEYDIQLEKGVKVSMIDYDNNRLFTQDGRKVEYQKVLVATGGSAIKPNMEGIDLQNVCVWRSLQDLKSIQNQKDNMKKVVVVGASFIGMEAASALKKEYKVDNLTVVGMENHPFERVLGPQVGDSLKELAEQKGIQFRLGVGVKGLKGLEGKVTGVELEDGSVLEADVVVMGVGIKANTSLFPKRAIDSTGGVKADCFLQSVLPNTYVAGDMASVPYHQTGQQIRVEHYNDAIQQGQVAAFNMLDKCVPLQMLPFFYTRLHDKSLAYTGYAKEFDQVSIDGDLSQQNFLAIYSKNDRILAAAGMMRNADLLLIQEAMKQNLLPLASELNTQQVTLQDVRAKLKKTKCGRCQRMDHCASSPKQQ